MIVKVAKTLFYDILSEKDYHIFNTYWNSPDEGMRLETEDDVEDAICEDSENCCFLTEWQVSSVCHQKLQEMVEAVFGKPEKNLGNRGFQENLQMDSGRSSYHSVRR